MDDNLNENQELLEDDEELYTVADIMSTNVACATPDTSLRDIAVTMRDVDCGAVPIVEDQESLRPIGVVTDRDITIRTVAEGLNPLELTAAQVMSDNPLTVTPETDLDECLDLMEDRQVRRAIVVDENGAVCGMVAQADIADSLPEETAEFLQDMSQPNGDLT
ncbi:MAG TPA: CBS domain-containing protein [Abditibacteriaceae bacterium]